MNKFLLSTEKMLAALSRRYSLTDVQSELEFLFIYLFFKQRLSFQVLALTDACLSHPLENWHSERWNEARSNLSWS